MSQVPVKNEVILASAGSGKTFRLSDRIVKLLAHGAKPEEIVALTFTRAAAAEFIAKTLAKLADAAGGEPSAKTLRERLALGPGWDDAAFRQLLRRTLLSMHRLTLGTLDSFFARLVVNNPAEVGLDGGQIRTIGEVEKAQIRRQVIARLMADTPPEEILELWSDLRDLNLGKDTAMPLEVLDERIEAMHDLLTLAPEEELWGRPERIWHPRPGYFTAPAPAAAKMAAQQLLAWLGGATFHATFKKSLTGQVTAIDAMTQVGELEDNHWKLLDKYMQPIVAGQNGTAAVIGYPSGARVMDINFPANICDAYRVLAGKAFALAIDTKLAQTQALHRLLSRFEDIYRRSIRQRGQLTFSDNVTLLLDAEKRGTKLDIDYRLDCSVKHWLFDEFQDTSTRQWKVLANNLSEVSQDGSGEWRTTFFVGDLKQSLYGWRGGNPELLRTINEDPRWRGDRAPNRMDFTHRCAQPVVNLVNALLGNLEPHGLFFSPEAAAQWASVFGLHESRAADRQLGEALWVRLKPSDETMEKSGNSGTDDQAGDAEEEEDIAVQARWIGGHLLHSGLMEGRLLKAGITCAILVSTNKQAAQMTEVLRKMDIEAADEANAEVAMDNPFTAGLVSLVGCAAHPSDKLSEGTANMAPTASAYVVRAGGWAAARQRVAQIFIDGGAEALLQDFLDGIDLAGEDNAHAFLRKRTQQLFTLAVNFDQSSPRSLDAFASFLAASTLRDTADPRAVQVLTIHRSKGLQYTAVYLPGLNNTNRKLASARIDDPLMQVDDQTFDPEWILCRPKTQACNRDAAVLARVLVKERATTAYENLCKIYVGMTRAVRRLVLVSNQLSPKTIAELTSKEKHGKYDCAMLLEAVLGNAGASAAALNIRDAIGAEVPWSQGTADWIAHLSLPDTALPSKVDRDLSLLKPVARISRIKPSQSGKAHESLWCPGRGEAKGREFGTLVHELLQHLEWKKESFLQKLAEKAWPVEDARSYEEAVDAISKCLGSPAVANLLLHQPAGAIQLWRERQAVLMTEPGKMISAVFDRVHIVPGQEAIVIDYKTNDCSPARLRELYQDQMSAYRSTMTRLCGLPEDKVRCVLIHVRNGELVEL
jgi:ATP-dependent exoDNAse (exonuclease V) beta subunit